MAGLNPVVKERFGSVNRMLQAFPDRFTTSGIGSLVRRRPAAAAAESRSTPEPANQDRVRYKVTLLSELEKNPALASAFPDDVNPAFPGVDEKQLVSGLLLPSANDASTEAQLDIAFEQWCSSLYVPQDTSLLRDAAPLVESPHADLAELPPPAHAAARVPHDLLEHRSPPHDVVERRAPPHKLAERRRLPHDLAEHKRPPHDLVERRRPPHDLVERKRLPRDLAERKRMPHDLAELKSPPHDLAERKRLPHNLAELRAPPHDLVERKRLPHDLAERKPSPHDLVERKSPPHDLAERRAPPSGANGPQLQRDMPDRRKGKCV